MASDQQVVKQETGILGWGLYGQYFPVLAVFFGGILPALMLQRVYFLAVGHKQNKYTRLDQYNRVWAEIPMSDWLSNFPSVSVSTIRRTLKKLTSSGFLIQENQVNGKGVCNQPPLYMLDREKFYSHDRDFVKTAHEHNVFVPQEKLKQYGLVGEDGNATVHVSFPYKPDTHKDEPEPFLVTMLKGSVTESDSRLDTDEQGEALDSSAEEKQDPAAEAQLDAPVQKADAQAVHEADSDAHEPEETDQHEAEIEVKSMADIMREAAQSIFAAKTMHSMPSAGETENIGTCSPDGAAAAETERPAQEHESAALIPSTSTSAEEENPESQDAMAQSAELIGSEAHDKPCKSEAEAENSAMVNSSLAVEEASQTDAGSKPEDDSEQEDVHQYVSTPYGPVDLCISKDEAKEAYNPQQYCDWCALTTPLAENRERVFSDLHQVFVDVDGCEADDKKFLSRFPVRVINGVKKYVFRLTRWTPTDDEPFPPGCRESDEREAFVSAVKREQKRRKVRSFRIPKKGENSYSAFLMIADILGSDLDDRVKDLVELTKYDDPDTQVPSQAEFDKHYYSLLKKLHDNRYEMKDSEKAFYDAYTEKLAEAKDGEEIVVSDTSFPEPAPQPAPLIQPVNPRRKPENLDEDAKHASQETEELRDVQAAQEKEPVAEREEASFDEPSSEPDGDDREAELEEEMWAEYTSASRIIPDDSDPFMAPVDIEPVTPSVEVEPPQKPQGEIEDVWNYYQCHIRPFCSTDERDELTFLVNTNDVRLVKEAIDITGKKHEVYHPIQYMKGIIAKSADRKSQIEADRQAGKKEYAKKVWMTEEEYNNLVKKYSGSKELADKRIQSLSYHKLSTGKEYASDYYTILDWDSRENQQGKSSGSAAVPGSYVNQPQQRDESLQDALDRMIREKKEALKKNEEKNAGTKAESKTES